MEAMQTRGNMMVTSFRDRPFFPNNFLTSGARIGLVGGSDHSRGAGPNRFCLTGLWVSDVTPQAVFDALRSRRTVATANGKIAVWATSQGKSIGESVSVSGSVTIEAHLACATPIHRVCLMRDGELLAWHEIGAPPHSRASWTAPRMLWPTHSQVIARIGCGGWLAGCVK